MKVSALRLALLGAVGLHLVAAAGWQWQRRGQPATPLLRAADDTPLLLQFSRQEAVAATPLGVPLPVGPLPPPPPASPVSPGLLPSAASAAPGRSAAPSRPPTPASQSGHPGSVAAPTNGLRPPQLEPGSPARIALEKALQEEATATATAGGAGGPAAQGGPAAAPAGRSSEAASGRGDERGSRSGESGTAADPSTTGGSDGSGQGGPSAAPERRLWGLAREVPLPQGRSEGLPEGLALRRLPLELARRSGARPVHLARTRNGDRLVLLWIEGSTLWLLSAPVPGAPG